MPQDDDETLRRRAYEIWEREGRPEGRHAEHWAKARDEMSGTANPMPRQTPAPGSPRRIRPGSVPGPNAGSRATNRRKGDP